MIKALLLTAAFSLPGFSDGFEAKAAPVTCLNGKQLDLGDGQPLIRLTGTVCPTTEGNGTIYAPCVKNPDGVTCARVVPPKPPEPVCKPLPPGFTVVEQKFEKLMGKPYPNSPSYLQPIGSFSLRTASGVYRQGKPIAGQVLTASFTSDGGLHKISWVGAQPVGSAGYGVAQAAESVTVAVSQCRGDLYSACKVTARSSRLNYGVRANVPACQFPEGTKLWLTVHYTPASLDPKLNTCRVNNPSGGKLCDSNFQSE